MNGTDPQRSTDPADFAFPRTLYRPVEERDACGTGFVASIAGERRHGILRMGVEAVINLTHRGAVSADGKTGDGAGSLTQIPHDLFRRELLGMGVRLERDADLGVGDHGCEYMTAGCVVILGETGRNFGAGMTNGEAYVLDEADGFPERYNPELVTIRRVTEPEDAARLRHLVERHQRATGSARAAELLARWEEVLPRFWKVAPKPPEGLREPPPRVEVEEVAAEPATVGAR